MMKYKKTYELSYSVYDTYEQILYTCFNFWMPYTPTLMKNRTVESLFSFIAYFICLMKVSEVFALRSRISRTPIRLNLYLFGFLYILIFNL